MKKVAIIGASSLTGNKLIEILGKHPQADVTFAFSNSFAGKKVNDIYPGSESDIEYQTFDISALDGCDVVFSCLPHGKSMSLLPSIAGDKLVIDLGADFRVPSDVFEKWYGLEHEAKDSTPQTYGLSEVFTEDIKKSNFIANPGCYPTSFLLALAPLFEEKIELTDVGVFSISGRSGAGRDKAKELEKQGENFFSYKDPYNHQHIGEMEYIASKLFNKQFKLFFFEPTVQCSVFQGMRTSILAKCDLSSTEALFEMFNAYYDNEPFVKINKISDGSELSLNDVVNKNDCLLGLNYDKGTKRLYINSVIDNLVKGASGQAVQNMNLALGWEQGLGLK